MIKHWSDCAVNNAPAYEPGPCDCGAATEMGVDHDCVELAKSFLVDDRGGPTAAEIKGLSEAIQTAIEDWFNANPAVTGA